MLTLYFQTLFSWEHPENILPDRIVQILEILVVFVMYFEVMLVIEVGGYIPLWKECTETGVPYCAGPLVLGPEICFNFCLQNRKLI